MRRDEMPAPDDQCPDFATIARPARDKCPERVCRYDRSELNARQNSPDGPVCHGIGRRASRVRRIGRRNAAGQSRNVADAPRARPRQPGVAALDGISDRPLPVRALRRARLRDDRLGCPRSLTRSARARSRDDHRGRSRDGAIRTARHLARRGGLHRLRRATSGSRLAYGAVRRLRARRTAPWRPGCRADLRGDHGAGQFVGKRQSVVSTGVHVAVHSRRAPTNSYAGSTNCVGKRRRRSWRARCCVHAPRPT